MPGRFKINLLDVVWARTVPRSELVLEAGPRAGEKHLLELRDVGGS
jgi:hypothetical protein